MNTPSYHYPSLTPIPQPKTTNLPKFGNILLNNAKVVHGC